MTSPRTHRAFTLIELLIAIFILGIGIVSIAALFPAGIAQQRLSIDDVTGPIVADNAMSILRTKLKQEDFGSFFEDFGELTPRGRVGGDWSWVRPGFMQDTGDANEGAIDVFSAFWDTGETTATEFPGNSVMRGVPWNTQFYGATPPQVLVYQRERFYPMGVDFSTNVLDTKPQYAWDCMFRRFQGRVQVAVFVYRVTQPGGGGTRFVVPPNPDDDRIPPLPMRLSLDNPSPSLEGEDVVIANGPWDAFGLDLIEGTADDRLVLGTDAGAEYRPDLATHTWQAPGQWITDQNGFVHRVLSRGRYDVSNGFFGSESDTSLPMAVELVRPVPVLQSIFPTYTWNAASSPNLDRVENTVTDIWYVPTVVTDPQGREIRLTPVYLTVQEL